MIKGLVHQKKKQRKEGWYEPRFKINYGEPSEEATLAKLGAWQSPCSYQNQKRWTSYKFKEGWCLKPIWHNNDQVDTDIYNCNEC